MDELDKWDLVLACVLAGLVIFAAETFSTWLATVIVSIWK